MSALVGPASAVVCYLIERLANLTVSPTSNEPVQEQPDFDPRYQPLYDELFNSLNSKYGENPWRSTDPHSESRVIVFREFNAQAWKYNKKQNIDLLQKLAAEAIEELNGADALVANDRIFSASMKYAKENSGFFYHIQNFYNAHQQDKAFSKLGFLLHDISETVVSPHNQIVKDRWVDRITRIRSAYASALEAQDHLENPLFVQVREYHPIVEDGLRARWDITEKQVATPTGSYRELQVKKIMEPSDIQIHEEDELLTVTLKWVEQRNFEKIVNFAIKVHNKYLKMKGTSEKQ